MYCVKSFDIVMCLCVPAVDVLRSDFVVLLIFGIVVLNCLIAHALLDLYQ